MKEDLKRAKVIELSDDQQVEQKIEKKENLNEDQSKLEDAKQFVLKQKPRKLLKTDPLDASNIKNFGQNQIQSIQFNVLKVQAPQTLTLNNCRQQDMPTLKNDSYLNSSHSQEYKQLRKENGQQSQGKQPKQQSVKFMPLQIDRTSVRYNYLTWEWQNNQKQLFISRFKGIKCHFVPAFLTYIIPPRGKHLLTMEVVRSYDYKMYFGITTRKAVGMQWTNLIPDPFIAFSFQRCCIIQKQSRDHMTMKQIIPQFQRVFPRIQMQVDMENHLITFTFKKNKKSEKKDYSITHTISKFFIQQAISSQKQVDLKNKLRGLVPFIGLQTDTDKVKFIAEG